MEAYHIGAHLPFAVPLAKACAMNRALLRGPFPCGVFVSTKSKIVLTLVISALAAAIVFGLLSFLEARKSLREAAFDELTAIRTARLDQVELYFESVFDEANVITENPLVADAVEAFTPAYFELDTALSDAEAEAARADLKGFYERRILPEIANLVGDGEPTFGAYGPQAVHSVYLQDYYIARNPNPRRSREQLTDTGGDTAYERAHARFHDELRFIVREFEYYDLFLIDHETGEIVYTVRKEADFATNIYTGPYRGSQLGGVVDAVKQDPNQGAVYMSDYERYAPSGGVPGIFIASGIYEDDAIRGILAIQLRVDDINQIMTSGGKWKEIGLKDTGETYIVGEDKLLRNESRFYVEDPDSYLELLEEVGVDTRTVDDIRERETAILLQEVDTEAVREALAGRTDTRVVEDYRGVDVLSAYAPLRIKDRNFALLAEIDAEEAFEPVRNLMVRTAITAAIFVPVVALFGLWAASLLMAPARQMQATARDFLDGNEDATFQNQGSDEWGQLGATLNTLLDTARARLGQASASEERVSEMTRQLMPRAIGERYLEGERNLTSADPDASVAVLVLGDDPAMNDLSDPARSRALYEALDDALDEVAARDNVDVVNQAGMNYVAVCGLTSTIKNDQERLMRFCREAASVVTAFNTEHGTDIDLRVGFDSGPVLGALVGTTAMAYEIWGPAVQTASELAAHADDGEVVVSQVAADRLSRGKSGRALSVVLNSGETCKARVLPLGDALAKPAASKRQARKTSSKKTAR